MLSFTSRLARAGAPKHHQIAVRREGSAQEAGKSALHLDGDCSVSILGVVGKAPFVYLNDGDERGTAYVSMVTNNAYFDAADSEYKKKPQWHSVRVKGSAAFLNFLQTRCGPGSRAMVRGSLGYKRRTDESGHNFNECFVNVNQFDFHLLTAGNTPSESKIAANDETNDSSNEELF
eukprot:TRINITY_DN8073_c0_g1_i1.p1 TRINITY_DN8073_c0_g1~~TRINITY_DN8073_c0_g1_i1.p1  ORF type:complete len:176 (+),score=38.08 TRINITY_DN8073_c0_g1_i1:20-547(+)